MITIESLSLQRGTKLLFNNVSLSIFSKQKIGLVGINGSGKSTLFDLLLRKLQTDSGHIHFASDMVIAHLSQEIPHGTISAIQFVMDGDHELRELLQKLEVAEAKQDHQLIIEIHSRLYEIDGYAAKAKAAKLLHGLGFCHCDYEQSVDEFSGGWRMRLNLARVLMCRSDLLLLDEPTNHLDIDTIIWLESWLRSYEGTLIIISHDRDFLDNVVTRIVHIDNQRLNLYSGNYSFFELQRAEKLEQEKALYAKQQNKIEHLSDFINRFRAKATKAKQVQSRLKVLEKMERVKLSHIDSPFSFEFYDVKNCSPPLIRFENINFAYGEKTILKNVCFSLNPGDRIGLLGPNGVGKTTFMKVLSGSLIPQDGDVHFNPALKIGYFAQHQIEQLDMQQTPFFHISSIDSSFKDQQIRDHLGGFGFRGDMIYESISYFSGGEKARLVLAMLVWMRPNVLLLDEPTNHLDLDMRLALTYALQSYSGALVLVSHDRYLLKTTVDELFLVHDQKVSSFKGDLEDYQRFILENRRQQRKTQALNVVNSDNKLCQPHVQKKLRSSELSKFEERLELLYKRQNDEVATLIRTQRLK